MNNETVAAFILATRNKHGWSQKFLADKAGTTQKQVSQIEAGKRDPSLTTLIKILAALDADIILTSESKWNPIKEKFEYE